MEVLFYPVFIVAILSEVIDIIAQTCFDLAFAGFAEMLPATADHILLACSDMFDDRMEIYSPGAMPKGRLIQNMDLDNIPSIRRNPVIADIFTQLGYMERKSTGMSKIIYPLRALPYFTERMLPVFFSDRAQFTVTFPNIIKIWLEEHLILKRNLMSLKMSLKKRTWING